MTVRRLLAAMGMAFVAAALVALPALGATPRQIYQDYADNGRLDGHYSKADLQNALHDATVQAYGGGGIKPAVIQKLAKKPKVAVLGVGTQKLPTTPKTQKTAPTVQVLGTTKTTGTLPFTGAELTLFVVVGMALIACGVLLRLSSRKKVKA
jgi:hypothetical protein